MTDTTTTPPQEGAASHEAAAEHKGFSLPDMHLAVGDRLQIECPAGTGMGRAFVRVIGYVDHLSILVTGPIAGNRRIDLVENEKIRYLIDRANKANRIKEKSTFIRCI